MKERKRCSSSPCRRKVPRRWRGGLPDRQWVKISQQPCSRSVVSLGDSREKGHGGDLTFTTVTFNVGDEVVQKIPLGFRTELGLCSSVDGRHGEEVCVFLPYQLVVWFSASEPPPLTKLFVYYTWYLSRLSFVAGSLCNFIQWLLKQPVHKINLEVWEAASNPSHSCSQLMHTASCSRGGWTQEWSDK